MDAVAIQHPPPAALDVLEPPAGDFAIAARRRHQSLQALEWGHQRVREIDGPDRLERDALDLRGRSLHLSELQPGLGESQPCERAGQSPALLWSASATG